MPLGSNTRFALLYGLSMGAVTIVAAWSALAMASPPPPIASAAPTKLVFPVIVGVGGVVPLPQAREQPRPGLKVTFDVTAPAPAPTAINAGLERAARLLNLYGAAGLTSADLKLTIVLHGQATNAILTDAAYAVRFPTAKANPNLAVIKALQSVGVEVLVCGQALVYMAIAPDEQAPHIPTAVAALTVVLNRQADGYTLIAVPPTPSPKP